jgi:hypothetical protein
MTWVRVRILYRNIEEMNAKAHAGVKPSEVPPSLAMVLVSSHASLDTSARQTSCRQASYQNLYQDYPGNPCRLDSPNLGHTAQRFAPGSRVGPTVRYSKEHHGNSDII